MTLGQEFSAYAIMIESAASALQRAGDVLYDINMEATAIGTVSTARRAMLFS